LFTLTTTLPSFPSTPTTSEYRLIAKKGEGTFSEVLKAQCVKNGKMTAIKCMKSQFESEEQVLLLLLLLLLLCCKSLRAGD